MINNDFFYADFGEGEMLKDKKFIIKDNCDSLLIKDCVKGTPKYLAPIIREYYF